MVAGFIASLNVAVAVVLGHAPFDGVVDTTAGAPTHRAFPVVKLQLKFVAKGMPKVLAAPVVIVAV
jgi:hypothetical protein